MVAGDSVVAEISSHHLLEPLALLGDGLMSASLQFASELMQLGRHSLLHRPSLHPELSTSVGPAYMRKPQEVEGLRCPHPGRFSTAGREAAKGDQAGLVGMQLQRKLLQSFPQLSQEPLRVASMLEPYNEIVDIARDDQVTSGRSLSPLLSP